MRIYRCWFCSSPIYPGHGTLFVRNDCKEFRFCRGKCHKAFKKHKNPRRVKWTKISRRFRKKELTDDLAQTFEKKRNSLYRYERTTVLKTLEAVPKIDNIKQKRESAFIKKRLIKGIELRKEEDIKLVNTQMYLIEGSAKKKENMEIEKDNDSSLSEEEIMDVTMTELENETEEKKATKKNKITTKKQKILLKSQ